MWKMKRTVVDTRAVAITRMDIRQVSHGPDVPLVWTVQIYALGTEQIAALPAEDVFGAAWMNRVRNAALAELGRDGWVIEEDVSDGA
jgi:hypothetical protein